MHFWLRHASVQSCFGSNTFRLKHFCVVKCVWAQAPFGSSMFRLKPFRSCGKGCGDASVRASPWPSLGNRFDVQSGLRMLTHLAIHPRIRTVFFLVLRMGAIVDFVNGGLRAPESPRWVQWLILLTAAFGPRKAHTSHNQFMLQCGLA